MNDNLMQMQLTLLIGQGRVFESLDLGAMHQSLDRAEGIGPFIDPSAFVQNPRKFDDLAAAKKFVEGAQKFQAAYLAFKKYNLDKVPAGGVKPE